MNKSKFQKKQSTFLYILIVAVLLTGIGVFTNTNLITVAAEIPTVKSVPTTKTLIPGGESFGVKFFTDGVVIVGVSEITTSEGTVNPALDAGIQTGDILKSINGVKVESNEHLTKLVTACGGKCVEIICERDGKTIKTNITPKIDSDSGEYRLGLWIRDSTAGIGTISFYDPENGQFGALGHGITDIDTGELMPLRTADIYPAEIYSVKKGEVKNPGELKGTFIDTTVVGHLYRNCNMGVFGDLEENYKTQREAVEIGTKDEVKEGAVTIICTIDKGGPQEYSAEIVKINKNENQSTKNMLVKITDQRLLDVTGGIVQGMSGSPMLQNGKIIGAVTHVLVNDPQTGYGIFIENMLEQLN